MEREEWEREREANERWVQMREKELALLRKLEEDRKKEREEEEKRKEEEKRQERDAWRGVERGSDVPRFWFK